MNKLFEDFVTVALRGALRGSGHTVRLQDSHHLGEAAAVRMRPDFVLCGAPRGHPHPPHALDPDQEPAGLPADVGEVARRMRNG